jgi:hypothetical protein
MISIPAENRRVAEAAASLPQQPMLEKPLAMSGLSKGLIADWKEFFRSRARRYKEWLSSASDVDKRACQSRERQPPTIKTKMFIWEIVESPDSMVIYMRNRQMRSMFTDLVDGDDKRVYDTWANEWDFFPDFITDIQSDPETGVPALCLAPPVELRPFDLDDDEDGEDFYNFRANSEQPEISSHLSTTASIHSALKSPSSRPFTPLSHQSPLRSRQTSPHLGSSFGHIPCPLPSSSLKANDAEHIEEHPEFSRDMEETLRFMYGWQRSYGAQILPSPSALDWRGVEKTLGFSSSPMFQKSEQSSIINFVSSLNRGPTFIDKLSSDLHDLDIKNHGFLGGIFHFREILRLEQDMFIFHSPSSNACSWVLGVESAVVALYITRFLVCNTRQTIFTVAHHLLERGIPFRTLLYLRSTLPGPSASPHSFLQYNSSTYHETKYHFTVLDFNSSMLICKTILNKIGRAALLRGGILGRIAREFLSIDTPLDGPSGWAAVDRKGFCIKAENIGYEYWDDELTEDEVAMICGTYKLYTGEDLFGISYCSTKCLPFSLGYGDQIKTVSWFPPPSVWKKYGFGWFEWTEASENFFTNLLGKIRMNKAQPRNNKEWRDLLRGFGGTRKLLDANNLRANQFMDDYCPVRRRT